MHLHDAVALEQHGRLGVHPAAVATVDVLDEVKVGDGEVGREPPPLAALVLTGWQAAHAELA
eukprot:259128-Hanusia_phi.AAC.1